MNTIITKIKNSFNLFLFLFLLTPILFLAPSVSAVSGDAIAVRIMPNPNHYDVEQWYENQGFSGSPQIILVDGYKGIRDGRTVYVNAGNVDVSSNQLYTNIYLISYNQESQTTTTDILGKLISHWKFNRNLTVSGSCSIPTTSCFVNEECDEGYSCGLTGVSQNKCILEQDIGCLTDSDCPTDLFCDSKKAQVVRDVHRLERVLNIRNALEIYNDNNGRYPSLTSGTYLPNISISTWPSWESSFGNQLGISSYFTDPINEMGACDGFEQDTCWDEETKTFFDSDPSDGIILPSGSHVIMYTTNEFGSNYDLCAGMESGFETQELSIQNLFCETEEGFTGSAENTPPAITDHILFGYIGEEFNGYVKAEDEDGDPITFTLITSGTDWSSWSGTPFLQNTGNPDQKKIFSTKSGAPGKYPIQIILQDGFNSPVITDLEIELGESLFIALPCLDEEICWDRLDNDCNGKIDDGCAECNNNIIEGDDEKCDTDQLNNQTCLTQSGAGNNDNFYGGNLACSTECLFDVTSCLVCQSEEICGDGADNDCNGKIDDGCPECNNNVIEGDEKCDQTDLGGETCLTQSGVGGNSRFNGGSLGCNSACSFDVNSCHPCAAAEICGDGIDNDCNGFTDIDDGCPDCGDGQRHVEEACDGSDLASQTCSTLVDASSNQIYSHGTLSCDQCSFDTSDCALCAATEVCGDGIDNDCNGFTDVEDGCPECNNDVKEAGEACDKADLGGETCTDQLGTSGELLFSGGDLGCKNDCSFDTSSCNTCLAAEICGNGIDDDCDGVIDNDCVSISLVIEDSGARADDAFSAYINGVYEGRTEIGQSSQITIDSLPVGQHELLIQFIEARDNCGTLNVTYSSNITVNQKTCFESQCPFNTSLDIPTVCEDNFGYSPYCTRTGSLLTQLCAIDSSPYYCNFFDGNTENPACVNNGSCAYGGSCTLKNKGSVQIVDITVDGSTIITPPASIPPAVIDDYPDLTNIPFSSASCSDGDLCTTRVSVVTSINTDILVRIFTYDGGGYYGVVRCNGGPWALYCYVGNNGTIQGQIVSVEDQDTDVTYVIGSRTIHYTLRY